MELSQSVVSSSKLEKEAKMQRAEAIFNLLQAKKRAYKEERYIQIREHAATVKERLRKQQVHHELVLMKQAELKQATPKKKLEAVILDKQDAESVVPNSWRTPWYKEIMNEYRHVRVLHQDLKKFEFDLNNLKHLVPKTLQAQQRVDYTGSFNMGTMLIFDPTKSYNGSTGELYYTRENEGGDANVPFLRSRVGSEDNRRQSSVASSRRKSVYSFSSSRRQTEGKNFVNTPLPALASLEIEIKPLEASLNFWRNDSKKQLHVGLAQRRLHYETRVKEILERNKEMTRVFLKTRTMGPYLTKKILDYDNDLELLQGSNIDNDEDKFYQNLRAQNGGGSAKSEGAVQSEELLSSRNDSPEKSPEKANNAAAQPRSASPLKSSTERSPAKNQARIIEETEQQQQQHTADNEEEAPSKFLTTHTSPSLSAFTFLKTDVSSNSGTLDNGEGSKDRHGRLHDYASEGEAEGEHIDEKNFTSWLSTTEFNSRVSTSENYKTRQSMVGYQNISLDNILSYSISSDLNDENGLDKDEEIESGNDNDGQLSMLVRSGKSSRKQSSNSLKASLASLKRREAAPKRPPPDVKALECLTMGDLLERQDLPLVVSKSRPVHPKWVILK